jgi:hypothetical protein
MRRGRLVPAADTTALRGLFLSTSFPHLAARRRARPSVTVYFAVSTVAFDAAARIGSAAFSTITQTASEEQTRNTRKNGNVDHLSPARSMHKKIAAQNAAVLFRANWAGARWVAAGFGKSGGDNARNRRVRACVHFEYARLYAKLRRRRLTKNR